MGYHISPKDMTESYAEFFHRVTGHKPFPYQVRYANNPFSNSLLVIPTGLGKTDAVLIPWLYHSAKGAARVPTRMVIVLPRQNLTAQTARIARERVKAAGLVESVNVLELMAGSEDNQELSRPWQRTVIVATQDLYFSRALNRGYARRPPRWPIDFALYNQDCFIVLDEIQLMDDALATSTQLDQFRHQFRIFGTAPCVWMSATANPEWLKTIDVKALPPEGRLESDDLAETVIARRVHAAKALARAPEECRTPEGCATYLLSRHVPGSRSLVIANTVPRAREIFSAVRSKFPGAILLHSRFRSADRHRHAALLDAEIPAEGQIVIATQVIEAGVDISVRLLITDIAPLGSLVQRFGRVNRYGEESASAIWWVDKPQYKNQKHPTIPYAPEEIRRAEERLARLKSAAPADLPSDDGPAPWRHVLRRADLLDLFDTSPDLSGNELDIARFIRATEDKDAYLTWREWEGEAPPRTMPELKDDELCPVSLSELRIFARKHRIYVWNLATEEWTEADVERLYPGMLLVTRCAEGGYTPAEGWSPESKTKVAAWLPCSAETLEENPSDRDSFKGYRQTLRDHTDRVVQEMNALLSELELEPEYCAALRTAAALHDWGKAHATFQETLHRHDPSPDLLAKQSGRAQHKRKYFRHELASALAMLATGESDLAAYLAVAHHGRIRLSIRSMPGECEEAGQRVAHGIRENECLPGCEPATGFAAPDVKLSLAVMEFGAEGGSWTDRMLRLRDQIGPFRLAYLEMLLRAADAAASADPHLERAVCTE